MMKDLIKNNTIRSFQDFILQSNSVKIVVTKKIIIIKSLQKS